MAGTKKPKMAVKTVAERVRAHRADMKAKGFRLVQMWLPDTRTAAFKREARRQCRMIAASPFAAEDQAFVDAVSIFNGG